MGVSNQFQLVTLLNGADAGASTASSAFSIRQVEGYAVQHVWSAGSVSRSSLIILSGGFTETGTFSVIDSYAIDGNAGDRLINVSDPDYSFIKVSISPSGSGGTITSQVQTKIR